MGECPGAFALPTVRGPTFLLAEHLGGPLVVHLASVDEPLDADVTLFIDQLRPEVAAVDVLTDTPPPTMQDAVAWRDDLQPGFPVAIDLSGAFGETWGRTTLFPTVLVLDHRGRVHARIHEGYAAQLPAALAEVSTP